MTDHEDTRLPHVDTEKNNTANGQRMRFLIKNPKLNRVMLINATFSLLCAAISALFASALAELIGINEVFIFYGLAVGLSLFAADLIKTARHDQAVPLWRVYYFSLSDLAWVLASAILIFGLNLLSEQGEVLVGGIAMIVAVFGLTQLAFATQAKPA